jgi:hypothetical protein
MVPPEKITRNAVAMTWMVHSRPKKKAGRDDRIRLASICGA